jgi:hypothetical protein
VPFSAEDSVAGWDLLSEEVRCAVPFSAEVAEDDELAATAGEEEEWRLTESSSWTYRSLEREG